MEFSCRSKFGQLYINQNNQIRIQEFTDSPLRYFYYSYQSPVTTLIIKDIKGVRFLKSRFWRNGLIEFDFVDPDIHANLLTRKILFAKRQEKCFEEFYKIVESKINK